MQSSSGCDGERSYQVLSCEVRASDEVASICQGEERGEESKTCLLARAASRDTPGHPSSDSPAAAVATKGKYEYERSKFPSEPRPAGYPPTARFPPSGTGAAPRQWPCKLQVWPLVCNMFLPREVLPELQRPLARPFYVDAVLQNGGGTISLIA